MTFRDLRLRVRALVSPRRVEQELTDELTFHIERETEKLVGQGCSRDEARARARARFGSVTMMADACRDVRGVGLVDTTARDLSYAIRTIRRAPFVAMTIVGTVAVGLGLVAAVFTLFNMFAFRVDAVRNPDELFAVIRTQPGPQPNAPFTRPEYEALRRETHVFADTVAMLDGITSRIDGRVMEGSLVTGNFFHMLGVRAAHGRALTPADDERLAGRPVLVLSHDGWSRLFARDPAVVGRRLIVGGTPFEIVGVMPPGFRGLRIGAPDYWAPVSLLGRFRPIHAGREDAVAIAIVGRLSPAWTADAAAAALEGWAAGSPAGAALPGQRRITLQPRQGTLSDWGEALAVFIPLFFAFGLILLIGCANVANLLLARAVARQREIGVRLSLGASRGRIMRQLLTENLLPGLAAGACALLVARITIDATLYAFMSTMAPELAESTRVVAPEIDWRVVLFVIAAALLATMLFGLMPALHATRLDVVRVVRGDMARRTAPGRPRQLLIAVQVTASALLLISSAVFLRSTLRATNADPGLRTADTLFIGIDNEDKRSALLAGIAAEPSVAAVAASWPDVVSPPRDGLVSVDAGTRWPTAFRFASAEYFAVLDIDVVRGRPFAATEGARTAVAIVSESLARQLWPAGEAVGRVIQLEADPDSPTRKRDEPTLPTRHFTVVGIARDVRGFTLAGYAEAAIYVPTDASQAETTLVARVHGDPETARRALLDRLTPIDPNIGAVATLRAVAGLAAYFLAMAFWLTVVLGVVALVFTISGLVSVLSYLVEQRRREIAVRVALGATGRRVMAGVLWQSVPPVAIGLLLGTVLAGAVATLLMTTPLGVHVAGIVHLSDPAAYAGSVLCIVLASLAAAAIPALRALRIDPMTALRHE